MSLTILIPKRADPYDPEVQRVQRLIYHLQILESIKENSKLRCDWTQLS